MYKLFSIICGIILLFSNYNGTSQVKIGRTNDSTSKTIINDHYIITKREWDEKTQTWYFLTKISHKDKNGGLLKLEQALDLSADTGRGETVLHFAKRIGSPLLAINCSTVFSNATPKRQASGILIVNSRIIQNRISSNRFTLGIKDNNQLLAYPPGTTAQAILDDGTMNALTAFTPLIVDYKPVSDDIIGSIKNYSVQNPRQVIAQFGNLDLLILSCGGRGYGGEGLKASDVIRILKGLKNKVKFAYNLDGGGSTTTVINGKLITPKIDNHGTKLRLRADFLYIKLND